MPERAAAPATSEALPSDAREPGARVWEPGARLQHDQETLEVLRRHADRLHALQAAALQIASLTDESALHRRILESALRLLEASGGTLDLGEQGQITRHLTAAGAIDEGTGPGQQRQPAEQLAVPIISREGPLGTIQLHREAQCPGFSAEDQELLAAFADHAAVALENQRLLACARDGMVIPATGQSQLAEALRQAAAAVSSTLNLEHILDLILEQVDRVIPNDAIHVMLVEDEIARVVRSRGSDGMGQDMRDLSLRLPDSPILLHILATGESVVIADTSRAPDWIQEPAVAWIRSCAAAPIHVLDNVVGFLCLASAKPGFFKQTHAESLRAFADQAGLALSNAQLFATVERAKRDWETTFDAMQDPVAVVDREGCIVRANRAFAHLVQKPFADLVGSSYESAMDSSICPEPVCPLEKSSEGSGVAVCVHELRGRVFEVQLTTVSEDTGSEFDTTARRIYALRDITQGRHAETEVRLRNRDLVLLNRIIATSATSPTLESFLETVCRELTRTFEASRSVATLFSRDKAESVIVAGCSSAGDNDYRGRTLPIERDAHSQHLLHHRGALFLAGAEADPYRAKPSSRQSDHGTGSSLLLPLLVDGEIEGSIRVDAPAARIFSSSEIDLAHRTADQVSAALARIRLEEAQRRLTAAVEQAAEGVMITDTDGNVLYANPAFEQITGHELHDGADHNPAALLRVTRDPDVRSEIWQAVTSGQTWQGRYISEGRDGDSHTVDSTVAPVRNQVGDVVNYVFTLRDITREAELERQFQQAQKMEALGRLAGGIAHDFNNLLTVIHLSARLLERGLPGQDSLLDHVEHIREAGERAARLTRQLVSFSRREVVEPMALHLNQIVSDLGSMLKRIIGEDVDLVTLLADELWPIRADAGQIEQVLMNLVLNARDAMPSGGLLTIETANVVLDEEYTACHVNAHPGEHVMLAVCDTGEGMDKETMAHLFEPFFTTKEQGKGTGLGLSTVFGIVSISGGHIRVESNLEEGTCFYIYFPRHVETDVETTWADPSPPSVLAREAKGTVLVVEDDAVVRELAVRVLESYGYRVLHAESGWSALRLSEQHDGPIDLLITDVVMPNMDGKELVERLRAQRSGIPVLYVSGYADTNITENGRLPLGTAFLSKPFSVKELIQRVRLLMEIDG